VKFRVANYLLKQNKIATKIRQIEGQQNCFCLSKQPEKIGEKKFF